MAIPGMDSLIEGAASQAGLPPDLIRIAICLFLSYPLCAVLKRLPDDSKALKEIYCTSVGIFYLIGVFSMWVGLRTLLISTFASFFITWKFRTNPLMPWLNFFFVLGHLFINHIDEQMRPDFDVNVIGITGSQMVLCMKLSSFGWNVWDGTRPDSDLSEFQIDRRVKEHPPLTEFLAYAFFFPSILTGPSYDFAEFRRWIDLSMFDVLDKKEDGTVKGRRKIPRSGRVAARKMVVGILWIALWTQITRWVSLDYAQSPAFIRELNFFVRIFYLYALGFTYRLKYYGAWYIAEGACILSGLGFNGRNKDGKLRWDRVRNVNPKLFETGQSTHVLLSAWNMNTNKWLKNYVYLRVTPKGRKPGFRSTLATFVTSAVWHGTRPGYYLTFVSGSFLQSLGRVFRRYIRPIFLEADGVTPTRYKAHYDIACFLVVQLSFGYVVQPFIILDLKPSLALWSSVYFYVNIIMAAAMILFFGPPKRTVINYLKSLHPKPATPSHKVKQKVQKLKDLRKEIEQLQSDSTLGIPQPDMEHMDEELQEAIEDFHQIKGELLDLLHESTGANSGASNPGSSQLG